MPDVPAMPPLFQRQMATPTTVGHGSVGKSWPGDHPAGTANNEGLIGALPVNASL